MIEALVDSGYDNIRAMTEQGFYADTYAALAGRSENLNKLKSLGLPLGQPCRQGSTAVHMAASMGRIEALEWFKNNQVDLHSPDEDNVTPFLVAAKAGQPEVVKYLLQDRPECISDCQISDGSTALILATVLKHDVTAQILLERNADYLQQDVFGFAALELDQGISKLIPGLQIGEYSQKRDRQRAVIDDLLQTLHDTDTIRTSRYETEKLVLKLVSARKGSAHLWGV